MIDDDWETGKPLLNWPQAVWEILSPLTWKLLRHNKMVHYVLNKSFFWGFFPVFKASSHPRYLSTHWCLICSPPMKVWESNILACLTRGHWCSDDLCCKAWSSDVNSGAEQGSDKGERCSFIRIQGSWHAEGWVPKRKCRNCSVLGGVWSCCTPKGWVNWGWVGLSTVLCLWA